MANSRVCESNIKCWGGMMLGTAPWKTICSFLKPRCSPSVCAVGPQALAELSARWELVWAWPCAHSLWFPWLRIDWNLSFWWHHWIAHPLVSEVAMFLKSVQTQISCLGIGNCLSSLLPIFFCTKRECNFCWFAEYCLRYVFLCLNSEIKVLQSIRKSFCFLLIFILLFLSSSSYSRFLIICSNFS